MKQVVILDDGISYFTHPSQVQKTYGKFWDEGIPICLAMTPALRGNSRSATDRDRFYDGIPLEKRGTQSPYKISDNPTLCNYLNVMAEQRLVEICIRGYNGDVDEFDTDDDILLQQKIEDGKSILERAFPSAEITTFLLPEATYSSTAIDLLTQYDYNICTYQEDAKVIKSALENSRNYFTYPGVILPDETAIDTAVATILSQIEKQDFVVLRQNYWTFYEPAGEPLIPVWNDLVNAVLRLKNLEIDTFTFL